MSSKGILVFSLPVIVVLGVFGDLYANGLIGHGGLVDLDSEFAVPAFWSGLLLVGASGAAVLAHRATGDRSILALAVLFAYMGIDEVSSIHENIEIATGIDWQTLLLPIMTFAAVDFVVVLRRYWGATEAWLLLGGGAAWGVSQLLEKLEWGGGGDVKLGHYTWKMVPEEMLEMLGSLLFLVSLLALWERLSQSRSDHKPEAKH